MHLLSPHPPVFDLQIRPQRSRVVLDVEGEVDCATAPSVADAVDELRALGWDAITMDVAAVTFMDSTGLRLLLETDARAGDEGWRFEVEGACPPLDRLLSLTGLQERLVRP